ncbi:MAG: RdgB/HAM1 family non-canonical purine NTP pyrophosphatase [Alphaproteobacteria bacterium]|nr:RdgB/HAM1 family non-canonical purine NTP pyrophosphatase [Alphaproteobacteria bacterium]
MIKELIIASHNQGKINEFKQLLSPFGVTIYSAAELNLPDVEETGTTFAENAALKAEALAALSARPCMADDSGLCVDALNGAPGVYSARYAPNRNFDLGISKLLSELESTGNTDWSAHFSCVLALKIPQQPIRFYEGRVNGRIIKNRRGDGGFGYDPVFVPEGSTKTFAEMTDSEKSAVSHRGCALRLFLEQEFNV